MTAAEGKRSSLHCFLTLWPLSLKGGRRRRWGFLPAAHLPVITCRSAEQQRPKTTLHVIAPFGLRLGQPSDWGGVGTLFISCIDVDSRRFWASSYLLSDENPSLLNYSESTISPLCNSPLYIHKDKFDTMLHRQTQPNPTTQKELSADRFACQLSQSQQMLKEACYFF